jgi:Zinc-binding dehydrogenase
VECRLRLGLHALRVSSGRHRRPFWYAPLDIKSYWAGRAGVSLDETRKSRLPGWLFEGLTEHTLRADEDVVRPRSSSASQRALSDDYAPDVPATLVKEGGRVASPTGAAGEGPGRTVMASPAPENLAPLAGLVADGKLRVPIQRTYELADAAEALTTLATTHTQGKLAIRIQ